MSRSLAALDRIIIALVGLVLIAGGVWAIALYFDEAHAQWLADRVVEVPWSQATSARWYPWALGVAMVLAAAAGVALILANLSPRRFSRMRSETSSDTGTIELGVGPIAHAAAEFLERSPAVEKVSPKVAMDRQRPTINFTIDALPTVDIEVLRAEIEDTEKTLRTALKDLDVDSTYRIHLAAVQPR